ncbi:hypothetical protein [Nakamurella endophytica]|uniref:Cytidine deaminase n=1 Tax=Nakamurella endophytica TaxID=1748367 RepID=A0A917SSW2_9ACTN|nr:hypothetical protein [Nakamurella endophytica]GGL94559.1 hypothetical protein GCM10011594_12920 [Nakamurella endophytica]
MLSAIERRVLETAVALAEALDPAAAQQVACAVIDVHGRLHTGVGVDHCSDAACAELAAVAAAAAAGAGPLTTVVAVGGQGAVRRPCRRALDLILDRHPDCLVVVPTADGPAPRHVQLLLPNGARHAHLTGVRLLRFNSRYHDDIVRGRKTSSVRYQDPVSAGPVLVLFEDEDGYRRLDGVVDRVEEHRLTSGDHELVAALRQHYPTMPDDAEVTTVHFHLQ